MSSDIEKLLPEAKVAGFTLRPWGLRQMAAVGPSLAAVIALSRAIGFDLGALISKGEQSIDQLLLAQLLASALPHFLEILRITLKVTDEKLDEIPPANVIPICKAIYQLNADYLKNSFAPRQLSASVVGAETL